MLVLTISSHYANVLLNIILHFMSLDLSQQFKILESIGLSESEANVYVANITLGPASVIELAQKSGYTRQMVYEIIPKLIEFGLIKKIRVGNRQKYQTTKPAALKDRIDEISNQIDDLIPVLTSHQASHSAIPQITVYENPLAMREWYKGFMEKSKVGDELLIFEPGQEWFELDQSFYNKFIEHSQEKKIKERIIAPDTPSSRAFYKKVKTDAGKYKLIEKWWEQNSAKWIWRSQVCILTIRENATNMIVIESKELAALERFNFNQIWESLPKEL